MPLAEALARAAVPLAGLAAMAAFAAREVDPTAAAESGYLAVVAAAVLAAVAFLAPAPALEAGLGAVLAAAAVWALPAGPGRGAAVLVLLVGTLAVAAGRRLARCRPELPLALAVTVPLALGLQALLRGDLLLAPRREPRIFVLLLLLPLAGALLTSFLSRRHGWRAAVAAGLALAATPGWTIAAVLALAALAGGDALAASRGRSWRDAWPHRAAGLAALLLPLAWGGRAGWLATAAGLALASPALGLAGAAALAAAALFMGPRELAAAERVDRPGAPRRPRGRGAGGRTLALGCRRRPPRLRRPGVPAGGRAIARRAGRPARAPRPGDPRGVAGG